MYHVLGRLANCRTNWPRVVFALDRLPDLSIEHTHILPRHAPSLSHQWTHLLVPPYLNPIQCVSSRLVSPNLNALSISIPRPLRPVPSEEEQGITGPQYPDTYHIIHTLLTHPRCHQSQIDPKSSTP